MASLKSYNSNHLHNASFSAYLNSIEETCTHKAMESNQNHSLLVHITTENLPHLRNKSDDAEIDVFSADKYFSGGMDEEDTRKANLGSRGYQDNKGEILHGEGQLTPKIQVQTPSVYSESSWNSQSALLRRRLRNLSRSKAKEPKKNFFAALGCNCPCADKNSVDIEDYCDDYNQNVRAADNGLPLHSKSIKTSLEPADFIRMKKLQLQNMSGKDYPLSGHSSSPPKALAAVSKTRSLEEEEGARKSLEVFGSLQDKGNRSNRSNRSFSLERKLNMLAWDAIPKVDEIEIQGPVSAESIKDTESDASSDLFEIECFSCSANPVVLPRHTLDAGNSSCVSPTTCYAPSEASVEWSVVTASAADISVVSDSEEQASTVTALSCRKMLPPRPKRPTPISELPKQRYGGILSGCKSQKAVRIAGDAYTTPPGKAKLEAQRITRSDSFTKMMRFPAETNKRAGFGSKYRPDVLYMQ